MKFFYPLLFFKSFLFSQFFFKYLNFFYLTFFHCEAFNYYSLFFFFLVLFIFFRFVQSSSPAREFFAAMRIPLEAETQITKEKLINFNPFYHKKKNYISIYYVHDTFLITLKKINISFNNVEIQEEKKKR